MPKIGHSSASKRLTRPCNERRSAARDALDRTHAAKQQAWETQDAAWQDLQQLRNYNGPRIDSLNSQQETAYQNMRDAFDRASSAYEARDGASAASYAAEGRRYKEESQDCVAERRRLVQELRDAGDRLNGTKPAFQRAKAEFDQAKRAHDAAKAEHERKQEEFRRAKEAFDQAVKAFKARLEKVRAESQRRRQDKRSVAERAGVPYQYLDNVYVSRQGDVYNIYFGGVGKPNGPGHGHYVMDQSGNVTYQREPFDQHGAQNFEDEDAYNRRQQEQEHRGGYGLVWYGSIDGNPVTAAFGWGTRDGHTLLADGHVDSATFKQHGNHNHYGPGRGSHGNVLERFKYSGPGS